MSKRPRALLWLRIAVYVLASLGILVIVGFLFVDYGAALYLVVASLVVGLFGVLLRPLRAVVARRRRWKLHQIPAGPDRTGESSTSAGRPPRRHVSTRPVSSRTRFRRAAAVGAVVLLWLAYTTLQTLSVMGYGTELSSAILGFLPGIAGIVVLAAAGLTREELFLRVAPLSRQGFAVLAAIFVFALVAIVPFGEWQGWNWITALVYAPASGVAQELFFRAVLLPAALLVLEGRPRAAIVVHAAFFSLWHIGPFFVGAPLWAAAAVMFVPFVSGIGWGWQVRHDRTVIWAAVQHSLIWVISGQFPIAQ